jgi:hypothetical protein
MQEMMNHGTGRSEEGLGYLEMESEFIGVN